MTALIERVIFRRKPGIVACFETACVLIIERAEALTASQGELLTKSL